MKYCSKCGNTLKDNDVFCSVCGAKAAGDAKAGNDGKAAGGAKTASAAKAAGAAGTGADAKASSKSGTDAKASAKSGTDAKASSKSGADAKASAKSDAKSGTGSGHDLKVKSKLRITAVDEPGARYTAAMERNAVQVTEYLERASDLEWQRYQIAKVGEGLKLKEAETLKEAEKESAAIAEYNAKAALVRKKISDYKKLNYRRKVFNYKFKFDFVLFAIIAGAFLAVFAIGGIASVPPFSLVFDALVGNGGSGGKVNIPLIVLLLVLLPAAVVLGVQFIRYLLGKSEHEKNEDLASIEYEAEQDRLEKETMESLNNDLSDFENIISRRENEKARIENIMLKGIRDEIAVNGTERQKLDEALEHFYANHAILPKYRSIVPVSTMCGFFESGRCQDLTGYEGAYNLYERELRQKLVLGDLEEIASHDTGDAEAQKKLRSMLEAASDTVSKLMQSVDKTVSANMENNPDGSELSKPLAASRELARFYEDIDSKRLEHLEYTKVIKRAGLRWF